MRLSFLPYDKAIDALEDLGIPHYSHNREIQPGTTIHFTIMEIKTVEREDPESILVIWENDEPAPTTDQVKEMVDKELN